MKKIYIALFRFLSVVLAGVAIIRPMMALTAVSSVIALPKDEYAAVQYANQSWAWLQFVQLASFVSIVSLFFIERAFNRVIWPVRGAFISQWLIVFLYVAFTIPINISTFNWTFFPDSNWSWLRTEWEYAHALSAIIGGISFVLLLLNLVFARWKN